MTVKLKKCLQCGSNLIDEFTNGKTGDAMFECQWCGRIYTEDEINQQYFEDTAVKEGLKHLATYAQENGAKKEYLDRLKQLQQKIDEKIEKNYKVIN